VVLNDIFRSKHFFDRICPVPPRLDPEVRSNATTVLENINEQRSFSFIQEKYLNNNRIRSAMDTISYHFHFYKLATFCMQNQSQMSGLTS